MRNFRSVNESRQRSLRVFDFDDTLVKTDAVVWLTTAEGQDIPMSSSEYAMYRPKDGDVFDYSEFEDLINPRIISWTAKILKNVYNKYGQHGVKVLTARGSHHPVKKFLHDIGIPDVHVEALGSSDPNKKAEWIASMIETFELELVEFFDDSKKNIDAVSGLRDDYPDVIIITRHIKHDKNV